MIEVGLFGALLAGVLSLISPCSALLLPAFFAYAFDSLRHLVFKTLIFLAGLVTVLVPIGAGVGSIGAFMVDHRSTIILVGGIIIIALGVYTFFGGGFSLPFSNLSSKAKGSGPGAVFFLGAVYGFAGFCAGPLLGAVLTTAAVSASVWYGAAIMAAYAVGMAIPLFILALLWEKLDLGSKMRPKPITIGPFTTHLVSMISGALFIAIGVLFIISHGTSAWGGPLSTDTQARVQEWAMQFANLSDLTLAIIAIVVLIVIVLFVGLRKKDDKHDKHDKHEKDASNTESSAADASQ
ncbi:cytochrome c biogenesis CcdA family protein [Corynebacterium propinquum]